MFKFVQVQGSRKLLPHAPLNQTRHISSKFHAYFTIQIHIASQYLIPYNIYRPPKERERVGNGKWSGNGGNGKWGNGQVSV